MTTGVKVTPSQLSNSVAFDQKWRIVSPITMQLVPFDIFVPNINTSAVETVTVEFNPLSDDDSMFDFRW